MSPNITDHLAQDMVARITDRAYDLIGGVAPQRVWIPKWKGVQR